MPEEKHLTDNWRGSKTRNLADRLIDKRRLTCLSEVAVPLTPGRTCAGVDIRIHVRTRRQYAAAVAAAAAVVVAVADAAAAVVEPIPAPPALRDATHQVAAVSPDGRPQEIKIDSRDWTTVQRSQEDQVNVGE